MLRIFYYDTSNRISIKHGCVATLVQQIFMATKAYIYNCFIIVSRAKKDKAFTKIVKALSARLNQKCKPIISLKEVLNLLVL